MAVLKLATAKVRVFKMIDSSDHVSPKTGLTVAVALSKNGGAFGAAAGVVAEISAGFYKVSCTTVDTGTAGDLAFSCTSAGADATGFVDQVESEVSGKLSATGLDAVLVAGVTLPNALKYIGGVLAGNTTGTGTTTEVFRDFAGVTAVSVSLDGSNNRTVTLS